MLWSSDTACPNNSFCFSDWRHLWKFCNIEEKILLRVHNVAFGTSTFDKTGKNRKNETTQKLGINFLWELCPKAVLSPYVSKYKGNCPETVSAIWNFWKHMEFFSFSFKSASPVIKTFQRGKINRVKNGKKISVGKKGSFYHFPQQCSVVLSSSSL